MKKGQASIEALLVICAMLSAMALAVPGALQAQQRIGVLLEEKKAASFLAEADRKACELSAFAEGTEFLVRAVPSGEWKIELGEKSSVWFSGGKAEREMECWEAGFWARKDRAFEIKLRKTALGVRAGD